MSSGGDGDEDAETGESARSRETVITLQEEEGPKRR
jgi:hypothetical protein